MFYIKGGFSMDTKVDKQYVIRYYFSDAGYETLGIATGKNEQDAIEAFLGREENKNEKRKLTANEITEVEC